MILQEFSYVVDFTATLPGSAPVSVRAKYLLSPQCFCYARGHLRALRVTGWTEEGSEEKKAHSINTPFPFHPAGGKTVFAELWLHTGEKSISPACKASMSGMDDWDPIEVNNLGKDEKGDATGDTLVVLAELIDPQGEVRCSQKLEVPWSKKYGVRDGEERAAFLSMTCGPLEPGLWHLQLHKDGARKPFLYRVPMLFLPNSDESSKLILDNNIMWGSGNSSFPAESNQTVPVQYLETSESGFVNLGDIDYDYLYPATVDPCAVQATSNSSSNNSASQNILPFTDL